MVNKALASVALSVGIAGGAVSTGWTACAAAAAGSHDVPARVLVIGDSTAAGTGAPPSGSVAGRIADAFAGVRVDNLGVNGARIADTQRQLERDDGPRPRLLLVMTGGNDVIRLASASRLQRDLDALLAAAVTRSDRVVLISPGNLAAAPALWWPFDRVLGWRSRLARDVFSRVAAQHGVVHLSMFRELDEDPFALAPERYFSADRIHPSAQGYALWYAKLRREVPLETWLAR